MCGWKASGPFDERERKRRPSVARAVGLLFAVSFVRRSVSPCQIRACESVREGKGDREGIAVSFLVMGFTDARCAVSALWSPPSLAGFDKPRRQTTAKAHRKKNRAANFQLSRCTHTRACVHVFSIRILSVFVLLLRFFCIFGFFFFFLRFFKCVSLFLSIFSSFRLACALYFRSTVNPILLLTHRSHIGRSFQNLFTFRNETNQIKKKHGPFSYCCE